MSLAQLEIAIVLATMFGSADAVPMATVKDVANLEKTLKLEKLVPLLRIIQGARLDLRVTCLPGHANHLIMATSPIVARFVVECMKSRSVMIEENRTVRTALRALGVSEKSVQFAPVGKVLAAAKQGDPDLTTVTFPDVRCVDYSLTKKQKFLAKKRHFGLEDSLTLRIPGLQIGFLRAGDCGLGIEWFERDETNFDSQSSRLIASYAAALEGLYGGFPGLMGDWRSVRGLCTDSVQAKRAFVPRLSEALIVNAKRCGMENASLERVLKAARRMVEEL